MRLIEAKTGLTLRVVSTPHTNAVKSVEWAPDFLTLAVGSADKQIRSVVHQKNIANIANKLQS